MNRPVPCSLVLAGLLAAGLLSLGSMGCSSSRGNRVPAADAMTDASATDASAGNGSVDGSAGDQSVQSGSATSGGAGATGQGGSPGGSVTYSGAPSVPARPIGQTPEQLEVWSSPGFRRSIIESYKSESDIEPRVSQDEREQMQEVLRLLPDRLAEAETLIKSFKTEDSSAVIDFTLANIHLQRNEYDQAAVHYRAAVDKFPKFLRAWQNLGVIHVRLQQYEQATEALTRVIELRGGKGVTYGLLGFSYAAMNDHLSAETAYRNAILRDSETLDWKLGLARSLFRQERYGEAATLVGRLIEAEPGRADLWLLQANAYIGLNQPMKAAENYELVDQLGGSTPASLNQLGDIYINAEYFGLAADAYIRAMKVDEAGGIDRAIRAAKILASRGALGETKRIVQQIEQSRGGGLTPEQQNDVLKLRSRIAVAEGAADEQIRVLEEIVRMDPLDGEALMLLGEAHARQKKIDDAIFAYERAIGLPKYEVKARTELARLHVRERHYDKAIPLLEGAQQIEPREEVAEFIEELKAASRTGSGSGD